MIDPKPMHGSVVGPMGCPGFFTYRQAVVFTDFAGLRLRECGNRILNGLGALLVSGNFPIDVPAQPNQSVDIGARCAFTGRSAFDRLEKPAASPLLDPLRS